MTSHTENISFKVGSLLVIWITAEIDAYIAEVTQEFPLRMKVMEDGPFAHLKDGDFILRTQQTYQIQGDEESQQLLLRTAAERKRPLLSGLKQLGCTDGKIHTILPA
jgi:hypothetical protein